LQVLKRVEDELEAYKSDMKKEFQLYLDRIDNILLKMSERGTLYLDSTLALTNVLELAQGEKLKADFEKKVVGDTR